MRAVAASFLLLAACAKQVDGLDQAAGFSQGGASTAGAGSTAGAFADAAEGPGGQGAAPVTAGAPAIGASAGAPNGSVVPMRELAPEPEGNAAITLLNGVADAGRIWFCLLGTSADGAAVLLNSEPIPAEGLPFGQSLVLRPAAEAKQIFSGRLEIHLIGSPPEDYERVSSDVLLPPKCSELLDIQAAEPTPFAVQRYPLAPPGGLVELLAEELALLEPEGTLPPSTMDAGTRPAASSQTEAGLADAGSSRLDAGGGPDTGPTSSGESIPLLEFEDFRIALLADVSAELGARSRSSLLVAAGCIGMSGMIFALDALAIDPEVVCGAGIRERGATLTPMLLPLSRVGRFDSLGLQAANASLALPALTLRSNPAEDVEGSYFAIGRELKPGEIRPERPLVGISEVELGGPLSSVMLDVAVQVSGDVVLSIPWSWVMRLSGIAELNNGLSYTVVAVGPRLGVGPTSLAHPGFLTLIANDPSRLFGE